MKSDERRLNASEEQRLSANGNQVAVNIMKPRRTESPQKQEIETLVLQRHGGEKMIGENWHKGPGTVMRLKMFLRK